MTTIFHYRRGSMSIDRVSLPVDRGKSGNSLLAGQYEEVFGGRTGAVGHGLG